MIVREWVSPQFDLFQIQHFFTQQALPSTKCVAFLENFDNSDADLNTQVPNLNFDPIKIKNKVMQWK